MAEIINDLGFDVSKALSALQNLDTALQNTGIAFKTFGAAINSWNSGAKSALDTMRAMATAAGNLSRNMSKMGGTIPIATPTAAPSKLWLPPGVAEDLAKIKEPIKDVDNAIDDVDKKTKSWTISWQTLGRVVVTQAIVRALSTMRDAFKEAYESALQFSKQVSEIAAINPERTFGEIATDLRQLSDSFNQPLLRVAEAQYQTISDQFVTTADRINILTAANLLAKTSNQDLADSAMLLTGALNAYGESSDMAGLRAAQFFRTVELGRLRMGELGQAMGRLQGLGAEVGVTMEELQASLIAITIGGVKPAEAATQMRGVMTALIKPSDDMKKALKVLGVESGESAIATWGLAGTLEKLWEVSGKTATGMSALFRNIRGDIGALRLAAEGAQKYAEGLKAVSEIDAVTLQKKFEVVKATDAEKLTAELNKIKNFFTVEFGRDLVSGLSKALGLLGGADGLVPTLRAVTNNLAPAVIGLGIFGAAMVAIATQARIAKLEVTGLGAGIALLALLPLAKGLGELIGARIETRLSASYEMERAELEKSLKFREEMASIEIRLEGTKNKKLVQQVRQQIAEVNVAYLEDVDNFEAAMKTEEKLVKASLNKIMDTRKQMTQELFAMSDTALKKSVTLTQEIATIQGRIADRIFIALAKKSPDLASQYMQFAAKAEELAAKAKKAQATALDPTQEKAAQISWERADAFAKMAVDAAKQSGEVGLQRRAEELLLSVDNKRIGALQQQITLQRTLSQEAEARAIQAGQHNEALERMRAAIEEKLKATVKEGGGFQLKSPEQFKKDLANADLLITEFVNKLRQYGKEDFTKSFVGDTRAFAEMRRKAEREMVSRDVFAVKMAPDTFASLRDQLEKSAAKLRIKVPAIVNIEKVTGMNIVIDGLQPVLTKFEQQLNEAATKGIKTAQLNASKMDVSNVFETAAKRAYEALKVPVPQTAMEAAFGGANLKTVISPQTKQLQTYLDTLAAVQKSANITDKMLRAVGQAGLALDFEKLFPGQKAKQVMFQQNLATMLEALKKQQELQKQMSSVGNTAEQAKTASEDTKAALQDTSMIDMSGLTNGILGAVGAMQQLAQAAYAVPSMGAQMAASGGKMWNFLAGGGIPRGTDTIPAMLSPGEMVINAGSARRFAAQLTAMNAGVKPVFHSEGGSVTNIGDINVSVTGGGSGRQTARSIATELRRELRRGTSTL